jgi:hypothetical protein
MLDLVMKVLFLAQLRLYVFFEFLWALVKHLFVYFVPEGESCFHILIFLVLGIRSFEGLPHNIVFQDALKEPPILVEILLITILFLNFSKYSFSFQLAVAIVVFPLHRHHFR